MIPPPTSVQTIQAHRATGIGGVDEAPLADINPDMAHFTSRSEEHQVAAGEVRFGDPRTLHRGEVTGGTWQAQVEHVAIDVIDQPAAIEAAFRGVATITIRRADQADRAHEYGIGAYRIGRSHSRNVVHGRR